MAMLSIICFVDLSVSNNLTKHESCCSLVFVCRSKLTFMSNSFDRLKCSQAVVERESYFIFTTGTVIIESVLVDCFDSCFAEHPQIKIVSRNMVCLMVVVHNSCWQR